MSIKTYTADISNQLLNVTHKYASAKTYVVKASDNITAIKFANDFDDMKLDDPAHPS